MGREQCWGERGRERESEALGATKPCLSIPPLGRALSPSWHQPRTACICFLSTTVHSPASLLARSLCLAPPALPLHRRELGGLSLWRAHRLSEFLGVGVADGHGLEGEWST